MPGQRRAKSGADSAWAEDSGWEFKEASSSAASPCTPPQGSPRRLGQSEVAAFANASGGISCNTVRRYTDAQRCAGACPASASTRWKRPVAEARSRADSIKPAIRVEAYRLELERTLPPTRQRSPKDDAAASTVARGGSYVRVGSSKQLDDARLSGCDWRRQRGRGLRFPSWSTSRPCAMRRGFATLNEVSVVEAAPQRRKASLIQKLHLRSSACSQLTSTA